MGVSVGGHLHVCSLAVCGFRLVTHKTMPNKNEFIVFRRFAFAMMMTMMKVSMLLACLLLSIASNEAYKIIPRPENGSRGLQEPFQSPLISFDGDLDRIHELALAEASKFSESYACEVSDSRFIQHLEIVSWHYEMETVSDADENTAFGEVQEATLEWVAPRTLSCRSTEYESANIVAMDSATNPTRRDDCQPQLDPTNKCSVINGQLRLFLSDPNSVQEAITAVITTIEEIYSREDFVRRVDTGVRRIEFLHANDLGNQNPVQDSPEGGSVGDLNGQFSPMLLVAIGSAALVVFVGSVYIWRRGHRSDADGAATQLAGNSYITGEGSSSRPRSPYSEMVAGSYRLRENMSILSNSNMSPVYEQEHEDTESASRVSQSNYTDSVAGAESDGYMTERTDSGLESAAETTSFAGSKFSSGSTPKYLGARPLPGAVGVSDMESDSEFDSSAELSPVKMFVAAPPNLLDTSSQPAEDESADESLLFSPKQDENLEDVPLV